MARFRLVFILDAPTTALALTALHDAKQELEGAFSAWSLVSEACEEVQLPSPAPRGTQGHGTVSHACDLGCGSDDDYDEAVIK